MIKVGEYNNLVVSKERDFGFFLKDNEGNEVLLPKSLIKGAEIELGQKLEVFVHLDSSNREVATLDKPIITVGQVGYLEVVQQSNIGAFCHNGIGKDLFIPMREQRFRLLDGKKYMFYAYIDKTGRIAGTTDVDDYMDTAEVDTYKVGDVVKCVTYARSGGETLKVAVDAKYRGIILGNEHEELIFPGDEVEARIKKIYDDGVIGLSTRKKRLDARDEIKENIILHLKRNGGFMEFNDKSNPEDIKREFKTSKNYFKMALGTLMKEGKIEQGPEGTKLIK